eukprot:m.119610 g.119610  ORF g.119610 m.119610 type:complete len:667 (+) comp13678_c2_seq2:21-2021(+)
MVRLTNLIEFSPLHVQRLSEPCSSFVALYSICSNTFKMKLHCRHRALDAMNTHPPFMSVLFACAYKPIRAPLHRSSACICSVGFKAQLRVSQSIPASDGPKLDQAAGTSASTFSPATTQDATSTMRPEMVVVTSSQPEAQLTLAVPYDDGGLPIQFLQESTLQQRVTTQGQDQATGAKRAKVKVDKHTEQCDLDPSAQANTKSMPGPTQQAAPGASTADAIALQASVDWVKHKLAPKLLRWCEQGIVLATQPKHKQAAPSQLSVWRAPRDAALVSLEVYANKYQEIKLKYGKQLVDSWPESTDPQKFVFEELGIAAFLCVLFTEMEARQKQSKVEPPSFKYKFVDLGCGNGLLTYVLNREGYTGLGIDLRKRKIWDLYEPRVELVEAPVDPKSGAGFPQCEWLLGNHSDELTPWIPIMAGQGPPGQHFWVLPCCHFTLNGTKFSGSLPGMGQYGAYLHHVNQLIEQCGFVSQSDVMRIPSTKRVCMMSISRSFSSKAEKVAADAAIQRLSDEAKAFVPRVESTVRNCLTLDKDFQHSLVMMVVGKLLGVHNDEDETAWNSGGELPLGDVAKLVGKDNLKKLKSECGGLQTLLKNHWQTFFVRGGKVRLRNWIDDDESTPPSQKAGKLHHRKKKLCWFHMHHPDGCPREAENCNFAHGEDDLVQSPE